MTTDGELDDLRGCLAVDASGGTAGTVVRVYISEVTSQPGWVVIATRPDGEADRFAPLANARVSGGRLILAVPARLVNDAPQPSLDDRGYLAQASAGVLYAYYARYLTGQETGGPASAGSDALPGGEREETAADGFMILSQERLRVGTETVVSGRARLVKYLVTKEITLTVSVSHEEVRVELEQDDGASYEAGESLGRPGARDGKWMILHAEQPVVQMQSVPVERVRLRVETVTQQQDVTAQIRREQIGAPESLPIPGASAGPGSSVIGDSEVMS